MTNLSAAIFIDRDGVINKRKPDGYITSFDEFEFLQGVKEALAKLAKHFPIFLITNQQGIGKGLMTEEMLDEIHEKMNVSLGAAGAGITAIYYCPHLAGHNCICRKPLPGMILAAAKDHNIRLKDSYMIGDSDSDIRAGKAAGCKTVFIGKRSDMADYSAESLLEAAELILADALYGQEPKSRTLSQAKG